MAKEAKIRIDIDTKRAQRATGELDKSVGEFTNSTQRATTRLREMQDELVNLEPGSERFRELAREAGQLQDQINKARAEIRAFSEDTFALQGTVGVIQGVTSAYSSATATMALFGAESEELIQVFARLELIQRSVNGLIQTYTTFQRGSAAMTFLSTTRTRLLNTAKTASNQIDQLALRLTGQLTVATGAQTVATRGATFATRALGVAMKALPIFAIIGGVTALISVFTSLGDEVDDVQEKLEKLEDIKLTNLNKEISLIQRDFRDLDDELKDIDTRLAAGELSQAQAIREKRKLIEDELAKLPKETKQRLDAIKALERSEEEMRSQNFETFEQFQDLYKQRGDILKEFEVDLIEFNLMNDEDQKALVEKTLERERALFDQRSKLQKDLSALNKTAANDRDKQIQENVKRSQEETKALIREEQFRLLKIGNLREDAIKEIVSKNSFERTFFGEADPTGRLKEIYDKLSEETKESVVNLANEAADAVEGSLKAKTREKVIWDELLKLDEFSEVVGTSIIDVIDQAQDDLGRSYEFLTGIISDEFRDQVNLLQNRLDNELINRQEFNEELFKLEQNKNKRLEQLDRELERINSQFNDRRNQAQRQQFDTEIRQLKLVEEERIQTVRDNLKALDKITKEDRERADKEIAKILLERQEKEIKNRFDEELKKVGELFGRNSKEYQDLVELQERELQNLRLEIQEETIKKSEDLRRDEIRSLNNDLRMIRQMTDTTVFVIKDAVDGSFEGIRFGFNALRDQLLDPDAGMFALIQSFKDGILEANQLILAGLEIGVQGFEALLANSQRKMSEMRTRQFQAETEQLKSQLANRVISQEQFDDRMQDLEDQKRLREITEQRKQFNREKAMNLSMAVINTAQAILQAIAQFGPPPSPAGIAGIAAAGTIGGVQAGLIAGQQFQAARGGIVPGSGPSNRDSVPALLAPGEAVINAESTRLFPQLLSAINRVGGGISLAPDLSNQNTTRNERSEPLKAYVVWDDIKEKMDFNNRSDSMNTFR